MRLNGVAPVAVLATVASVTPAVHAWGAAGHEIIATIAQIHLHPSVLPKLCDILDFHSSNPDEPECHLAPIAAWADKVRWRNRWSASLHYIGAVGDDPSETCLFPGDDGWAGKESMNVIGGMHNTSSILREWVDGNESDEMANEALKFFVHFVGDMHQPLHLTGRDRGGNSDKVLFDGRQTNLHSLWDGLLIAKHLRTLPYNYTRPLPVPGVEYNLRGAIYDPLIRQIMWEGIMQKWKGDLGEWVSCPSPSSAASIPTSSASSSTYSALWSALPSYVQVLWESLIPTYERSTDSIVNGDDEELCPYYWAKPLHELNCEIVWPPALDEPPYKDALASPFASSSGYTHSNEWAHHNHDYHEHFMSAEEELGFDQVNAQGAFVGGRRGGHSDYVELDTPEYAGKIAKTMLIEKLLAQGGIRLAAILNRMFADV